MKGAYIAILCLMAVFLVACSQTGQTELAQETNMPTMDDQVIVLTSDKTVDSNNAENSEYSEKSGDSNTVQVVVRDLYDIRPEGRDKGRHPSEDVDGSSDEKIYVQTFFTPGSTQQGAEPIRVTQGQEVTLEFYNVDNSYGLMFPEFGRTIELKPFAVGSVTFTPQEKGTFNFYCFKGCESKVPSQGVIIVE